MIIGAALDISISLLVVVLIGVCLLMTLVILMQKPKQEGLGASFGGGMTDQMFGAQTTNVLQKITVATAALFLGLNLLLSILVGWKEAPPEIPEEFKKPEMGVIVPEPQIDDIEKSVEMDEAFGDGRAKTQPTSQVKLPPAKDIEGAVIDVNAAVEDVNDAVDKVNAAVQEAVQSPITPAPAETSDKGNE